MKVMLLGAGRIGQVHAAQLARDDRVERIFVVDTDARTAAALAGDHAIAVTATVDGAFAAEPDAAIIAAPTPVHGVLLERCVEAGVPTLCEKPLAKTLTETISMVRSVEAAKAVVQVGLDAPLRAGERATSRTAGGRCAWHGDVHSRRVS